MTRMEQFKIIDAQDFTYFKTIVGEGNVLTDETSLDRYSRDYTEDLSFKPAVIIKPKDEKEISEVLSYCNDHKIAVTPRGAGTSLSGGALPVYGGVVLSTERLNQIIEIDEDNFMVTLEPGVINEELREQLNQKGFTYPPDPASKGSCFIGGNIAHSSGGPQALKYGTTKEYVLNLEVVLANGEVIWTGSNTIKNSTGYNLTQLMVGSEGTLGIVSKAVIKIIPAKKENILLVAGFNTIRDACSAVAPLFKVGLNPSLVELLDRKGVDIAVEAKGVQNPFPNSECFLMIGFDGPDRTSFEEECQKAYEVCLKQHAQEVLLAESNEEQERFWDIRRSIGEVVKQKSIYKEEDTVVPRNALPIIIDKVIELEEQYGFNAVCYGHAGDGNLHINILKENMTDDQWNNELPKAIRSLFEKCKELKGTISGEHGIGYVQKEYMDVVMTPSHFRLLQGIKSVFDPNGILNPGKIF